MAYAGGKDGAGVWQRIVNQIPPHDVWVSAFAGDCAVTRHIRPAAATVLIDLDREVLRRWELRPRPGQLLYAWDAVTWLREAFFRRSLQDESLKSATAAAVAGSSVAGSSDDCRQMPRNPTDAAADATFSGCRAVWEPGAVAFFRGLVPQAAPVAETRVAAGGDSGSRDPVPPRVFVYADPPYLHSTRGKTKIYRHELDEDSHMRLLTVLRELPCQVLLHGYPSTLYSEALQDWRTFTFKAMTRGGMRTEQVWCNYREPLELHDYSQVGTNKRQRERIRRRCRNWSAALARVGPLERGAILQALAHYSAAGDD